MALRWIHFDASPPRFPAVFSNAHANKLPPGSAGTRLNKTPQQICRGRGLSRSPTSMLGSESEVSPWVPHMEYIRFNEETEQRVALHAYTHMILVGTTTQICSSTFSFPVVHMTFNRHSPEICRPALLRALLCHTGASREPLAAFTRHGVKNPVRIEALPPPTRTCSLQNSCYRSPSLDLQSDSLNTTSRCCRGQVLLHTPPKWQPSCFMVESN